MITWVLILTLAGATNQSGQAIASVHGFTSQQACMDAGAAWTRQVKAAEPKRTALSLCVVQRN